MEQTKTILKKTWVVAALACVCCLLWGSAVPLIKTGCRLMQMDSADTARQILSCVTTEEAVNELKKAG